MSPQTPAWDDLRILLVLHRERSFLAAGRVLGVASSTVARRIEALERALARPLVHRGPAGTRLAPEALRLVAMAEEVELGLAQLARDGGTPDVSGTVRVSLPEGFIRFAVPTLARLHIRHPALAVELISESRVVDLARGEADVAMRLMPSTSPALVSRSVGRAQLGLFASREYVDRRLPTARLPRASAALHDWVGLDETLDRMPAQLWLKGYGASRWALRSNSALAVEHAVLAGLGIGLLSELQARPLPSLVQLELEEPAPAIDVFVAFHREAGKSLRVRTVARALEAEARRQLV